MNISRVTLNEKIISGICINTNNKKASNDITKLWNEFYTNNITKQIQDKKSDSFIYGVYSDYESDLHGNYTVTAGVEINRSAIKRNNTIIIKKGKYILFENIGQLPEIVIQTWKEIWTYFEEHKDIKRKYTSDFESYEDDKNIKIYIAIK
jgi:predicted transcriptional regulator YdeE